jgi:serine/threonine-protein kinase
MDGFRNLSRSFVEAAALGLLATAVLYVPPAEIARYLDGWLFDGWSRLAPPPPPADIVVVHAATPTEVATLLDRAERGSAALVISTLPQQPPAVTNLVIGPVEIPWGTQRTRPTDWLRGGHLLVESDIDGVVRRDSDIAAEGRTMPSLAEYAARALGETVAASGNRWLRFYEPAAVPTLSAEEAIDDPSVLRDRVVIVGGPEQVHATPFGLVGTAELVAEMFSNHRTASWLASPPFGAVAGWLAAALLLVPIGGSWLATRRAALTYVAAALVALLTASAVSFNTFALWLPTAGPAAWLALAGTLLALRKPAAAAGAVVGVDDERLVAARRAAADGRQREAWLTGYRQLGAAGLLPELYELGAALEDEGDRETAAEVFERIVQADSTFRDAAARLVRTRGAESPPADEPPPMPATLGRYELLEPIGRGAMGYVYLARDPIINRIMALKAIDLTLDYDSNELASVSESFLREAAIAGSLNHPNIVTIYDVGRTEGLAFIAMEYVRGRHLSEFAVPDRLLPVATVLDLLSRAATALDYAHGRNVVHRDIKPANIMYDSASDTLKITDFGIAKLIDANRTRTGIVLGTPAFMSPEQLEGRNVNGHTDLFALGVSLYQLLTGQLPFRGASMTKLMFVIANEPHPSVTTVRGDLPAWLDSVVDRALAKDPAARFQSGAEMAAALRGGLATAA